MKNKMVSLKSFVLMCMVAISGVLLLSCGKGGSDADSIPDDGLFGSAGAEFVDLFLNEPDKNKMQDQLVEELMAEMEKKYPGFSTKGSVQDKHLDEYDQEYEKRWAELDFPARREKWDKRFPELVAELSDIEIPVKVEEGTPLKLLSPVKLKDFDKTIQRKKVVLGFTAELTEDVVLQKGKVPEILFMNAADSILMSFYAWDRNVKSSDEGLKKGTRLEMETTYEYRLSEKTIKDYFSAKYVMLTWNTFCVDDGKLGPIQVGMSYKDLPKSVPLLYDKFDYRKEMVENEMDGGYEVEECIFFKNGKEYFRTGLEDGRIASIVLDENSGGLCTKEGYSFDYQVSNFYRTLVVSYGSHYFKDIRQSLDWDTYYEGEVFVTIGRYTFYVPSDQTNTETPRTLIDFKNGAKCSRIVCK